MLLDDAPEAAAPAERHRVETHLLRRQSGIVEQEEQARLCLEHLLLESKDGLLFDALHEVHQFHELGGVGRHGLRLLGYQLKILAQPKQSDNGNLLKALKGDIKTEVKNVQQ